MNQLHLNLYKQPLLDLLSDNLIKGLGISIANNDYTIIKTGDSNYLFLHDKKYIETTTGKKSGITFNIFYFKDNKGEDISIALANDYSTLIMLIGNSVATYTNK